MQRRLLALLMLIGSLWAAPAQAQADLCARALARVYNAPTATAGGRASVIDVLEMTWAFMRQDGHILSVPEWTVTTDAGACLAQLSFYDSGQTRVLTWRYDPATGAVTPVDEGARQISGE